MGTFKVNVNMATLTVLLNDMCSTGQGCVRHPLHEMGGQVAPRRGPHRITAGVVTITDLEEKLLYVSAHVRLL